MTRTYRTIPSPMQIGAILLTLVVIGAPSRGTGAGSGIEVRCRSEVTPRVDVSRVRTACSYARRRLYLNAPSPSNKLTNEM